MKINKKITSSLIILLISIFFFLFFLFYFYNKKPSFAQQDQPPPRPSAVSNIVISDITTSSLKISWDHSSNTLYYKIQRGYQIIGSTTNNYFIDTDLAPNTVYRYVIESVNQYYGNENKYVSMGTYSNVAIATTSPTDYYDFYLSSFGALNVVQGHDLYVNVYFKITNFVTTTYYDYDICLSVLETSTSTSADFFQLRGSYRCNEGDKYLWRPVNFSFPLRIKTSSSTPLGKHTVKISAKAIHYSKKPPDFYLTKELIIPFNVIEKPKLPLKKQSLEPLPELPLKRQWEENMVKYGRRHCSLNYGRWGCCGWEGGVWYYDGMRVFYNILDYTKDETFYVCTTFFKYIKEGKSYRQVVFERNGRIWGWRLFTTGLTTDYFRTGDELSKQAVLLMAENGAFASFLERKNIQYAISSIAVREISYAIIAYLDSEKLGQPESPNLRVYLDILLGHFDQWFNLENSPQPFIQPFYVGLATEALIRYFEEKEQDPRIPFYIKQALDFMWDYMRVELSNGDITLLYTDKKDPWEGGYPYISPGLRDLNLLIAPAYAWYYSISGDREYIRRGDLLFQAGVKGAWLDNGKQFSENYRWSFDYLKYRDNFVLTPFYPKSTSVYPYDLSIRLFHKSISPYLITYGFILRNISTSTIINNYTFNLASFPKNDFILPYSVKVLTNKDKISLEVYTSRDIKAKITSLNPSEYITGEFKVLKR